MLVIGNAQLMTMSDMVFLINNCRWKKYWIMCQCIIFYCDYYDQQFGDVTDMKGGDDKWEQYQLFQERGIKTPEVIALIKRNVLQRTNGISF